MSTTSSIKSSHKISSPSETQKLTELNLNIQIQMKQKELDETQDSLNLSQLSIKKKLSFIVVEKSKPVQEVEKQQLKSGAQGSVDRVDKLSPHHRTSLISKVNMILY